MRAKKTILSLILVTLSLAARADILIIANPASGIDKLSVREIAHLYLGRQPARLEGISVLLLDQPRDSAIRERFFKQASGMSVRNVDAYWARLQFSGNTQPPVNLTDNEHVLRVVMGHPQAVGYVDSALALPDRVRILTVIRE